MGMDLIGAGFTRRSDKKCSVDAIDAIINAIPDDTLRDEEYLSALDPNGVLDRAGDPEHVDFPDFVRDILKSGAREYDSAISGHRMSTDYYIQGTPLEFVWTGGGSWGDDPFEGFSDLCLFIDLASQNETIREASGFVCGGLPGALMIAHFGGYV